jgi:cell division protein FtsW
MWGVGLGKGTIKLGWLPEDTTDFIFAVIGEELGFAGCAIVISLYFAFILCGLLIAYKSPDRLGSLVALGITGTVGSQAAMNLLVVTGMAPTKGIALPFISAGGSGLVVTALAVGVLVNVAKKTGEPLLPAPGAAAVPLERAWEANNPK